MKSNLFRLIAQLEAKTGKPYPYQTVAQKIGVHRHTIETLAGGDPKGIHFKTISGLLDFFAAEGMPITVSDLFAVSDNHAQPERERRPEPA